MIAPIYLRLGRFDDAVKARRNALRLNGETAERQTELGEALVAAANGVVTAEAKAAFERAVALDPSDVKARYFLGLAAEQDGDREQAVAIWRAMLAGAPPDAPWVEFVRAGAGARRRCGIAPGPSDDQVAAASDLSPEQRAVDDPRHGRATRRAPRIATAPTSRAGCGWCAPIWCWAIATRRVPRPPMRAARWRAIPTSCASSTSWPKDWVSRAELETTS